MNPRSTFYKSILLAVAFGMLATNAGAFTPKEGYSKVLIYKRYLTAQPNATAPPVTTLLSGLDGELLYEYQAAHLSYVRANAIEELRRRATVAGVELMVADYYDVMFLGWKIDARLGLARSVPSQRPDPPYFSDAQGTFLLQFAGPIKEEWVQELEAAGVTNAQYIPYNAFICAARPSVMSGVARLPFVQFVEQLHRFLKPGVKAQPGQVVSLRIGAVITPDTPAAVLRIEQLSISGVKTWRFSKGELSVAGNFDGENVEAVIREPLVFWASHAPAIDVSGPSAPVSNIPLLQGPTLALLLLGIVAVALSRLT